MMRISLLSPAWPREVERREASFRLPPLGLAAVAALTPDGHEIVEAALPAIVTVSNELGEPRTPTIKGLMGVTKVKPTVWKLSDLAVDLAKFARVEVTDLFIPVRERRCEIIKGENDSDSGRMLALKLREAKLI